jgi:hypothetical protein
MNVQNKKTKTKNQNSINQNDKKNKRKTKEKNIVQKSYLYKNRISGQDGST